MELKGSQTEKNLLRTFAGESRARNKYTFYSEKAKAEGYEYIASIFEETAGNERAHARVVLEEFLGMVGNTAQNLREAAMGETAESTKIYKEFERVARAEGFKDIADFYKEVAEVEENHSNRYTAILTQLEKGM